MSKKQASKSANTKTKPFIQTEDWNSRFWIGKIQEYKPKSAVSTIKIDFKIRKAPQKLPKIKSAHVLVPDHSPMAEDSNTLTIFKASTENNSKSESRNGFTNNCTESNSESKRSSKIDISKDLSRKSRRGIDDILKCDFSKGQKRASKMSSEDLKKPEITASTNKRQSKFLEINPVTVEKNSLVPLNINLGIKRENARNSFLKYLPKLSQGSNSGRFSPEQDNLYDSFEIKETNSESEDDEIETKILKQICEDFCQSFIDIYLNNLCPGLAIEAYKEMVSAALVLFSSSILDKYIIEILSQMIPKIAKEVHSDSTVIEYIDLRDNIVKDVFEEEITKLICEYTIIQTANMIMEEYSYELPIEEIVNESISEEKAWNKEIVKIVGNHLVDCLIEEEWVEVLAEDEINSLRLEHIWKFFPPNLQKDISKAQAPKIIERIADHVYFDILNEIVGGIWVEGIVRYCLSGSEQEILEMIMPVKFITKKKTIRKYN